jgi:hypothetical protein
MAFPLIGLWSQRGSPRLALGAAAIFVAVPLAYGSSERDLFADRTYFGMYRVKVDEIRQSHYLLHGTTSHGAQSLNPEHRFEPLTYFHRTSPIGQAFAKLPQLSKPGEIAVVGLGVGSLASYLSPGQLWTFYEIDPAVETIARNEELFTYLSKCGTRCRVAIGDARLSLQKAHSPRYSLIVLDAFSSDAVPVHLMTREALILYLSRLAPDGVLAFHVSNRHLELNRIVGRLASTRGLVALEQMHYPDPAARKVGAGASHWVLVAREPAHLEGVASDPRWKIPPVAANTPLWTDDFSNILSILTF